MSAMSPLHALLVGLLVLPALLFSGVVSETPLLLEAGQRYVVGFHEGASVPASGTDFAGGTVVLANPGLRFAAIVTDQPERVLRLMATDPRVRYVEPDMEVQADALPDDPKFSEQYGPAQVRATQAWDTPVPPMARAVCILDTGVRYTHEDLRDRWLGGHDLVNNDTDPWDDNGHGTHVAGTAAAVTNNGIGIAGIAPAGILGVKVLNAQGRGLTSVIAIGIQWCADHGGHVISMSLGRANVFMQVEQDAARYAWQRGSLLVASAGNSGPCTDCIGFPARLPEVIAVTCTGGGRSLCSFSSSGPQAELAAPGFRVLSTCYESDSAYCVKNGTSMSAPHVSGAAALLWSHQVGMTHEELRLLLRTSARDLGSPGLDEGYGYGIVDASSILAAKDWDVTREDSGAPTCRLLEPRFHLRGLTTFRAEASSLDASMDSVKALIDRSRPPIVLRTTTDPEVYEGSEDTLSHADGIHTVEVRCEDTLGRVRSMTRDFRVDNSPFAQIDSPIDRAVVAGPTDIVASVDVARPISQVFFSVDEGPEVDIMSHLDPTIQAVTWDSTIHAQEQFPATLRIRTVDEAGGVDAAGPVYVTVNNRPDPSVAIVDPPFPYVVAGVYPVRVRAASNVGDVVGVEIQINGRPWVNITGNRAGEDYYYLWNSLLEPGLSNVTVRATDSGGVSVTSIEALVVGPQLVVSSAQGFVNRCAPNPLDCLPGGGN